MILGKFKNLGTAKNFSYRTIKASAIIMGDDEMFWVVHLSTMERMLMDGYEVA